MSENIETCLSLFIRIKNAAVSKIQQIPILTCKNIECKMFNSKLHRNVLNYFYCVNCGSKTEKENFPEAFTDTFYETQGSFYRVCTNINSNDVILKLNRYANISSEPEGVYGMNEIIDDMKIMNELMMTDIQLKEDYQKLVDYYGHQNVVLDYGFICYY